MVSKYYVFTWNGLPISNLILWNSSALTFESILPEITVEYTFNTEQYIFELKYKNPKLILALIDISQRCYVILVTEQVTNR